MEAGKLRHRGTLESPPATLTSRGQRDRATAWTKVATVFYGIQAAGAGELIRGRQVTAEATHRLRIRYRPNVTPKMRIVDGTRTFEFVGVSDTEDRQRMLEIDAKELV